MQDEQLRADARQLAEEYAPQPISSYLMYGVVGVSLVALGWAAFAGFYDIDPFAYPVWVAFTLVLALVGAVALRRIRSRRQSAAYGDESKKAERD